MAQAPGMTYEEALAWIGKPVRIKPSEVCPHWGRAILTGLESRLTAMVRISGHRRPDTVPLATLLPWKAKAAVGGTAARIVEREARLRAAAVNALGGVLRHNEIEHRGEYWIQSKLKLPGLMVKEANSKHVDDVAAFYHLEIEQQILNRLEHCRQTLNDARAKAGNRKAEMEKLRAALARHAIEYAADQAELAKAEVVVAELTAVAEAELAAITPVAEIKQELLAMGDKVKARHDAAAGIV